MMYPYMTLPDETEISHSQMMQKNGQTTVEVHFERPTASGFDTVRFVLPSYDIIRRDGHYSDEEIDFFRELLRNHAHLIFEYAQSGGICCA